MPVTLITEALKAFVRKSDPGVLSLKGKWGVGKTYYWRAFIRESANNGSVRAAKYAYVSLFGLNTLDQLKSAIFEQTQPMRSAGQPVGLANYKANIKELLTNWEGDSASKTIARKVKGVVSSILGRGAALATHLPQTSGYSTLIRSVSFLNVRDTLICLDDFERKGPTLSAVEILGLVALLTEQRNCKIILIFNEDSLDDDARKWYATYREKIIDTEVAYAPSVEDVVSIVFPKVHPWHLTVLDRFRVLKTTNIRILQKTKFVFEQLSVFLINREKNTQRDVAVSTVLLCWAYFSKEQDSPSLDYIKKLDPAFHWAEKKKPTMFAGKNEPQDLRYQQEDRHKDILREYGWTGTDEIDLCIMDLIEQGFTNSELLNKELETRDRQHKESNAQEEIDTAWRIFHSSFWDNQKEFVDRLIQVAMRNARHLSRGQLNSIVRILNELEFEQGAKSIVDEYVRSNRAHPEAFNTDTIIPGEEPLNSYIVEQFFLEKGLSKPQMQLADAIRKLSPDTAWSSHDEAFLSKFSEDDFYQFLKEENNPSLHRSIRGLLMFTAIGNATTEQQRIGEAARKALVRIAKSSKLNALRVRRHNIPIGD